MTTPREALVANARAKQSQELKKYRYAESLGVPTPFALLGCRRRCNSTPRPETSPVPTERGADLTFPGSLSRSAVCRSRQQQQQQLAHNRHIFQFVIFVDLLLLCLFLALGYHRRNLNWSLGHSSWPRSKHERMPTAAKQNNKPQTVRHPAAQLPAEHCSLRSQLASVVPLTFSVIGSVQEKEANQAKQKNT